MARLAAAVVIVMSSVACRGSKPASASDVVVQFYTMHEAVGMSGAPSPKELAAIAPFITTSLAKALARADSLRSADKQRSPNEKPSFVEGDLFSSLFEGATDFYAQRVNDSTSPARVLVSFSNTTQKPKLQWSDTAIVERENGQWRLADIHYGGTWPFSNKGALLSQLPP